MKIRLCHMSVSRINRVSSYCELPARVHELWLNDCQDVIGDRSQTVIPATCDFTASVLRQMFFALTTGRQQPIRDMFQ
jgi:hypothetical protein